MKSIPKENAKMKEDNKMKKRWNRIASLLMAATMAAGLAACGGEPADQAKDNSTTEDASGGETADTPKDQEAPEEQKEEGAGVSGKVTMVTTGTEYEEVMAAIKKALPDVELVWEQQGSSTFADTYKTRLTAGAEGLDVFTPARSDYPVLAQAGQLLEITDKDYLANYTDGVIDSAAVDGKVYGVPVTANCYIMWYNKDVFAQYNIAEPATFEELEAACATLKENGVTPLVAYPKSSAEQVAAIFYHDLLSKDPQWLDKLATGEAKWTDEESVAALKKLESWMDAGYILDGSLSLDDTQAYQAFYQGQAAMLHNGTWSIDKVAEAEPDFEIGVFPFLAAEGTTNRAQYCPGSIWAVAADSSNAEAAEAVVEWISQPENAQLYCSTAKQFGTVKGVTFDFHPAAASITPFYSMDKTQMMHAFLTANAKSELAAQVQMLMSKEETNVTVEDAAAAIQAAQDKDNAN